MRIFGSRRRENRMPPPWKSEPKVAHCSQGHEMADWERNFVIQGRVYAQPCGCPVRPLKFVPFSDSVETKA